MNLSLPGALFVLASLMAIVPSYARADVAITDRMHHLRSGAEREWSEFSEKAEGSQLVLTFEAKPRVAEHTLRLRHRDLKQPWRVLVNGKEIARLPSDEADMITYWPVPAGTLQEGANALRIECAGKSSDDVAIGELTLIERPRDQVLSEATVDVSVREAPGGRAIPSRLTVVNEQGTLMSLGNASGAQHAVRAGARRRNEVLRFRVSRRHPRSRVYRAAASEPAH